MVRLIILQGIPASGKSTWAKQFVTENPDYVRVCRDDLRRMRGTYWLPIQEDLISKWEKEAVGSALKSGYSVVLDATNLNGKHLKQWVTIAASYGVEVEFKPFHVELEECLKRDAIREDSVGEGVIRNMYKNYCKLEQTMQQVKAGADEPFKVEKIIQDATLLPKAIIVDLDGTLALHNERSAYEFHRCDEDLVNQPVANVVCKFRDAWFYVIFLSGREDNCASKTTQWLIDNAIWDKEHTKYIKLFMRQTGDRRKDCIVKKEIFDREIRDKYFVEFCLDDRDQVVKLWRDMGLTCLQVNYGNF